MGNRAVITLDKEPSSKSVGIYLHWNGGPESVLAFAEAARKLGVRSPDGDAPYCLARLTQIIGNFFGGTTSIGIGTLDNLDTDNGDNGTYSLQWTAQAITLRQCSPRLRAEKCADGWQDVDLDAIRKTNSYWQPDAKGETILDHVVNANKSAFTEKD